MGETTYLGHSLPPAAVLLLAGVVLWAAVPARAAAGTVVVEVPPAEPGNNHYVGHRAPLTPAPLIKLPIGAIRPEGWLRGQLEILAEGMVGHLPLLSRWCRFETSAWANPQGLGEHGWEEMPYWLRGFGDLGYVLGDERIIAEARRWTEAVLASTREDGYFGPRPNEEANDFWPHMVMLYALRSLHEATGDERVLPVMTGFFRYLKALPPGRLYQQINDAGWWQGIRGADMLDSIHWLYNRTGEPWLLELARINHEATADWTAGIASWHGVNICECFRGPAQFWVQSRQERHLKATLRNYDAVWSIFGQMPGGLFGADENCREGFTGPRQGAETCSIVEFMHSCEVLLKITGDGVWADRCEDAAINSLPAAMSADMKSLRYVTAANQVQCDRRNRAPLIDNWGDMYSYRPDAQYRCCQHNVAFGWPYYAEHAWMATGDNGLAAVLYAPCTVRARVGDGAEAMIVERTDYPFDGTVELSVSLDRPAEFPLVLRVPGWCDGAAVKVNGSPVELQTPGGRWIVLRRTWNSGDAVRLDLPMTLKARLWETNDNSVSLDLGPLTFALKIGEEQRPYTTDVPWPSHELFPTTPWNYALAVDPREPAASFKVVRRPGPVPRQPFTHETAPVVLEGSGRRIAAWKLEGPDLVGRLQPSPVAADGPDEPVTLVPMGCARLRIASFPWLGESPQARPWVQLPPITRVAVSYQGRGVAALDDGRVPGGPDDTGVPRFTWRPGGPTRVSRNEWVEYVFLEPVRISSCEVYWVVDDAPEGCRLPESWKLSIRGEENRWQDLVPREGYPVSEAARVRVGFEPVEVRRVRLSVTMQAGHGAGLYEWTLK